MAKTVIGLFDSFGEAQQCVDDLMRFGVSREAISVMTRDESRPAEHEVGAAGAQGAAEGAGAGAVGGTLVGGAIGLLVGAGLLVIPGIGPVLAAGPLAAGVGSIAAAAGATALGAGLGAAAGGLLGGLLGAGVPEETAHAYVEGVRRGGTLVTVNASDVEADDVRELMLRNGAVDIDRRAGEWRSAGWEGVSATDTLAETGRASIEPASDRSSGSLADVDRKVLDPSYTDVDRTGERVKSSSGYTSGHAQPVEHEPQAFSEFVADDERNFRTQADIRTGDVPRAAAPADPTYRDESYNTIERSDAIQERDDLLSESSLRSSRYAGADEMGGALSNMSEGSGSDQPGRAADEPGATTARIYEQRAEASDDQLPAHGDYARGQRDEPGTPVEPDYARGMHSDATPEAPVAPHHGDYARGQRDEPGSPLAPDYARGQRSFEHYDNDFLAHYRTMTGAGGQPYDYYKPGYQFGYDVANDPGFQHEDWTSAEPDAQVRWERDARGSWEEFKQTIRYGWEKARGLR